MTLADNPNSRLQQYCLTRLGYQLIGNQLAGVVVTVFVKLARGLLKCRSRYNVAGVILSSAMPNRHNFTIHHASLIVSDTEKSLTFYCDVLGMRQIQRPPLPFPGAWLEAGQQQIHLLELDNPDPIAGRPAHGGRDRHVAFLIDSYDALRQDLLAAGIEHTLSISGRRALFCRDRDGNALEFIERS